MSLANAALLTEDRLARWLIENSPIKLQIARVWPFMGVSGGQLSYARSNAALTPGAITNDCSPVNDDSDTAANQTFDLADYITRYAICFADEDRYEHPNNLDATENALAIRKLLYAYFERMDTSTGTTANGGLRDIIGSGQTVGMGETALTLDCMDHAYNLVTANNGRPTHIMTSSRGLRTYQSLCRAAGYEPPKVAWTWYDPAMGRMVNGQAPAFNGTPILINDMMVSAGSTLPADQRIYFMVLGDDGSAGPGRGVIGFVPEARRRSMFIRREMMGTPNDADPVPNSDRTVWISFPAGLGIGSQGALSLITDFTPVTDCTAS